jgi:hypothetical protein
MNRHAEEPIDPNQPALVVTYGVTPHKVRPLRRDLVVIGQGRGCDVGLVSPEIAEAHCVLFRTAKGWRLRDCGSRIGTRLNGKPAHESALYDGDVLQVGTFNFRCHLPGAAPAADGGRDAHLEQSRRHLARLALALRRRLREKGGEAGPASTTDLDRQMAVLRERLRLYEQRAQQLQQAEREVADERDRLRQETEAVRTRGEQAERALAQRRSAVEADLRRRREQCEERFRELERREAEVAGKAAATDPEEAYRLELRRRELACYADYLRRNRRRHEDALEELRQENHRLRQRLAGQEEDTAPAGPPPAGPDGQVEELRAELEAARRDAEEKESQIQQLLTARLVVDASARGMDVESYEAELAEFRRQLQADRRGLNEEIRMLRQRTLELDEAARAMEQQLTQERERLAQERRELDRLRGGAPPPAAPAGDGLAVVHRFRERMAALAGLQPRPAGGDKVGSNGRGYRVRAPRVGNGSGNAGR